MHLTGRSFGTSSLTMLALRFPSVLTLGEQPLMRSYYRYAEPVQIAWRKRFRMARFGGEFARATPGAMEFARFRQGKEFSHGLGGEPTFAKARVDGWVAPKAAITRCDSDDRNIASMARRPASRDFTLTK